MREYARQRKLRRWIVRVPFLSLSLSSRWLTLITPVYAAIGRSLIASVRNPSVVLNPAALSAFDVRPMRITRAIERALANEDRSSAETRWSDAFPHRARGRINRDYAAGRIRAARFVRDRVLVSSDSHPRSDVPGNAAPYRGRGSSPGDTRPGETR